MPTGKVRARLNCSLSISGGRSKYRIPLEPEIRPYNSFHSPANTIIENNNVLHYLIRWKNHKIIPVYENEELSAQYQLSAENELERKHYEEALKRVEQAIYKAPNNYKAHHTLACLLSAKGYSDEAFDIYRNAQRIKKSSKLKYYTKNSANNLNTFIQPLENDNSIHDSDNYLIYNIIDSKIAKKRKLIRIFSKITVPFLIWGLLLLLPSNLFAQDEPSERYYPFDFYHQPNNHVKMGRNFLEWYGSGDVNNDGVVNYEDYVAMDTVTPGDRTDIDGDGTPSTENDKEILKQYLDGEIEHLPGYWNELNTTEKIEWYQNMEAIYWRDLTTSPGGDCTERARNRLIDFAGIPNFEEHPLYEYHEHSINNARFNIPMIEVSIGGISTPHAINALYVGDGTEGDVTENLIDGYLYIENNGAILDPRDYIMNDSSYQVFKKEGYYNWIRSPPAGEGDFFTTWHLLGWEMDENLEVDTVFQSPEGDKVLPFDPLKYDTITFKGVPENKLINYQSDLDISERLEEKVDTAHSKLKPLWTINPQTNDTIIQYVFTETNYENSEKINLGQEHEGEFYNYKFVRKAIAETPWIKDSVSWEIEVKDIEAPKINDFPEDEQVNYSTSLDLENYVVPENLEVTDNSGLEAILEKSTESTQTTDGTVNQVNFDFYTDITATDKFGNDTTYRHKAEVRDTEAPEGNLSDYYVQRESGQSPEEAVKSLVENVYDNSELPVDTLVEQTSEKFYDVFLKDVAGNENYLGNVEADWPVGTGDEIKNSEIAVYPNPVNNILYISSSTPIAKVVVTGTDGVKKLELLIHNASVDISALEPGIYILELYNLQNEKLYSRQMVVQ